MLKVQNLFIFVLSCLLNDVTITEFSGSSGFRTYSGTLSQSKMYWCSSLEDSYIVIIIIVVVIVIIIK